ncbi:MAG: NAD(P)-dependent alcohol dehydrogenase [Promethearchaeota archaeon Loki_b32]|nr:MAG: NAD(P)-dependent alcohol dehydrogenase [Candidatus Lokiarchaeota archaeon Loki_b32]
MKAIVYEEFGSAEVLELKEVDKPTPKDDELLVKVHATSVNAIDMIFRSGATLLFGMTKLMAGFKKPKHNIIGFDVSGEVESVGKNVIKFKNGDLIYACLRSPGANAEYVRVPEKFAAIKPANMTHEEAAAVPDAGGTALTGLIYTVTIKEGQRVLIFGASGGVGTYALQIARTFTTEVTGVCSTSAVSMVKSLGANAVIDYTKEDFTKNGQTYDIIFDAVGRNVTSYSKCKNSLTKNGIFVTVDFQSVMFKYMLNKNVRGYMGNVVAEKLDYLRDLIEAGKIKSVVDKVYPLSQMADAHRYYEEGHPKGKIVITIQD